MTSLRARTGADLLYVVVDLDGRNAPPGTHMPFDDRGPVGPAYLARQFENLAFFAEYCQHVAVVAHLFDAAARSGDPTIERDAVTYASRKRPVAGFAPEPSFPFPVPTVLMSLRVVKTKFASPWVTILGDLAANSQPIAYGVSGLFGLHRLLSMIMAWQRHRVEMQQATLQLEARSKVIDLIIDHASSEIKKGGARNLSERSTKARQEAIGLITGLFEEDLSKAIPAMRPINTVELVDEDDPRVERSGSD